MADFISTEDVILEDENLRFFNEYTPFAEGSGLTDFCAEAEEVVKAVAEGQAMVRDKRARRLLLLRGFYFLGVLRGGEAYRNTMLDMVTPDQPDPEPLHLDLDKGCAQLFAEDLNSLTPGEVAQLCHSVGM